MNRSNTIIDAGSKLLMNSVIFILSSISLCISKLSANVLRLALSGVEPTPSHYKYNKTFHSAADFP
jgi:hypothetical protein